MFWFQLQFTIHSFENAVIFIDRFWFGLQPFQLLELTLLDMIQHCALLGRSRDSDYVQFQISSGLCDYVTSSSSSTE